ncbi:MAG: guanylate kinase [Candidatus Kerfeldbacteria bacterium]|nr:guanylate kinase [Candidatus Kerfeldbacteria bacterium]
MGTLFVVTGPSGAGKDSVIAKARDLGLSFASITTTSTRPMRPGEAEGNPYYFVSKEEFEQKIDRGEMIEYAEVYGNYYGSTRAEVERVLKGNDVVVVKVDPQGARTFKEMIPEAHTIFIKPPSFEALEHRLVHRASDAPEVIAKRLEVARQELENLEFWNTVIVNEEGKLEDAAKQLIAVVSK